MLALHWTEERSAYTPLECLAVNHRRVWAVIHKPLPPAVCPRPHLFSSAQLRSDVICSSNDGQSSERWWVPLYTNTITEARRVISTGKEETVLKNDTVVSIVTFFALSLLQLFSL